MAPRGGQRWCGGKLGWLGVAALVVFATGCVPTRSAPKHLVLITLDTTRVEMLGSYGGPGRTPFLDSLAGESLRFEQVVTTAPYTGPSHASILTGLEPPRHGLRDFLDQVLPQSAMTLPEILSARGFQTGAFVSSYVLDPLFGFDQGFDVYSTSGRRPNGKPRARRPGEKAVDDALAWLETRDPDRRVFLWLHLYDAHGELAGPVTRTYRAPRRMQTRLPPGVDASSPAAIQQRYYEQAGLLDEAVERLLVGLREAGLYDEAIVAVTADHGELLGAHGRLLVGHSPMLVDATVLVPLLLRIPGITSPGVVEAQVSVVDLMPTVLEALELPVPDDLDGRSLLRAGEEPPRIAYSETFFEHFPEKAELGSQLVSLREGRFKLLVGPDRIELFDLIADPAETHDVGDENPEVKARLLGALAERRARWGEAMPAAALDLDPRDRDVHIEQLRSLGYVE